MELGEKDGVDYLDVYELDLDDLELLEMEEELGLYSYDIDEVITLAAALDSDDDDGGLDGYGLGVRPSVTELDRMRLTVGQASRVDDEWAGQYLSDVGRLLMAYDDLGREARHYRREFYRAQGELAPFKCRPGDA